ncbi:glycosyltransferase [Acidobacteriota bacterium]
MKNIKRILVLQGGADGWNGLTRIITRIFEIREDVEVVAVAGPAYKFESEMGILISQNKGKIVFKQNISNIHELMLECDAAISGCGLSIFELLCLGVPSITLTDEDKELETAQRLEKLDCVLNLGELGKLQSRDLERVLDNILDDLNTRKLLYSNGSKEVPGNGAELIVREVSAKFKSLVT